MKLTEYQKKMLKGDFGKGAAMAMEIQCAIGEGFEAERMVPVSRVHAALSAQNADIWFAEKMADAGASCRVSPTVNPGYCCPFFEKLGVLNDRGVENMRRTQEAYRRLGATLSYSCTPYLFANTPHFGEILAFSETSATIFVNAVIGARTNRESAASAICAGITGFVPEYGMLLPENRLGTIRVQVDAPVRTPYDFAMLGLTGKKIGRGVPVFTGLPAHIETEALIALGAQLNVSGTFDMFHIPGVTPEAPDEAAAFGGNKPERTVIITEEDLKEAAAHYSAAANPGDPVDYIILGCPHYTFRQVQKAADILKKRPCKIPVWILTSKAVRALASDTGLLRELEALGVQIIPDTCVDESCCFGHLKGKFGATDSPKGLYYMESFGIRMAVRSMETCLEWAVEGMVL